jgi:HD superfamily phosphohydrolase YqeK
MEVSRNDLYAPKLFHAMTAAAIIPDLYPQFADEEIIGCVRWHTTGRAGMSLCEQIVYLADYIDMSRTFEDCVTLRNFFFDKEPEKMDRDSALAHLRDTMILSFDMTLAILSDEGLPISVDTLNARNDLICARLSASR